MAHFSDVIGRILLLHLFIFFKQSFLFYMIIPVLSPSHSPILHNSPDLIPLSSVAQRG